MKKVAIDENAYPYPMPMVVLGVMMEERPNFMAVGWVTRVNFQPPMIAVALGKRHYTNGGIHAAGAFSVNVPGTDLLAKVDYCGIVSGRDKDKSALFTVTRGEKTGAPLIEECPLAMECRLRASVFRSTTNLRLQSISTSWASTISKAATHQATRRKCSSFLRRQNWA